MSEVLGKGKRKYYLARAELARQNGNKADLERYSKLAELLPSESEE